MENMKTITVTHQNAVNYGAALQAYALQKQLSKLGVDDKILDLEAAHPIFNGVKFNKHLPGNMYGNILNLLQIVQTKRRIKRFKEFVKNNIKTTQHYRTIEEVFVNPPVADAYITGSDQTFNIHLGERSASFLRFGSEKTKRISYAASMGRPVVEDKYIDEFVSAIKTYSFLSVRECCSADYITKISGLPCQANLDPTLLLSEEEWLKLASISKSCLSVEREKYILVYQLLKNPILNDAVKKIKKETGLKVVVINPYAVCGLKGNIIIRDAGPIEFLNLYKNAEIILTTSFHGTCFSIIFQKPFFSFIRQSSEIRITNLLNILNLNDRIITDSGKITSSEIVYNNVTGILEMERKKANEYLIKALGL